MATILHYGGNQWTEVNSPTGSNLSSVVMESTADGWAVGDNGTILHYTGGLWSVVNSPTIQNLN